jgi:hypothetical protein
LNLLDPSQQSTILKNNLPLVSEEGTLEEQGENKKVTVLSLKSWF